uniref:Uncharacterized protein n=1 Tax=Mus musculus TaxID=10090 RepID=Q3TPZ0_MOUSE|nr:unnamed protein product [Mus musculus]
MEGTTTRYSLTSVPPCSMFLGPWEPSKSLALQRKPCRPQPTYWKRASTHLGPWVRGVLCKKLPESWLGEGPVNQKGYTLTALGHLGSDPGTSPEAGCDWWRARSTLPGSEEVPVPAGLDQRKRGLPSHPWR